MFDRAVRAFQQEQSACIAPVRRNLRNKFGRQVIMKVGGPKHNVKIMNYLRKGKRSLKKVNIV